MQRVRLTRVLDGAAGADQGLSQHLAPKYLAPSLVAVARLEQVLPDGLQIQMIVELLQLFVQTVSFGGLGQGVRDRAAGNCSSWRRAKQAVTPRRGGSAYTLHDPGG